VVPLSRFHGPLPSGVDTHPARQPSARLFTGKFAIGQRATNYGHTHGSTSSHRSRLRLVPLAVLLPLADFRLSYSQLEPGLPVRQFMEDLDVLRADTECVHPRETKSQGIRRLDRASTVTQCYRADRIGHASSITRGERELESLPQFTVGGQMRASS
jgi:hypothetical protein